MVRTGARARVLGAALTAAGFGLAEQPPTAPRLGVLPADTRAAVEGLYRGLGGKQEPPVLRPGGWDLALVGGVVIELDEELHFNRYRSRTLATPWSTGLPWFGAYLAFCSQLEDHCLRAGVWGKRWTNESCERMFGPPAPSGDLDSPGGAPRWKQRALYDAIKDAVTSVNVGVRLVRLSVHDELDGVSLGAVLEGRGQADPAALRALVERRTA